MLPGTTFTSLRRRAKRPFDPPIFLRVDPSRRPRPKMGRPTVVGSRVFSDTAGALLTPEDLAVLSTVEN